MMTRKMRLNQGGNGGKYDEFGDCVARRAFIFLVIFLYSWYYSRAQLWYMINENALKVSYV